MKNDKLNFTDCCFFDDMIISCLYDNNTSKDGVYSDVEGSNISLSQFYDPNTNHWHSDNLFFAYLTKQHPYDPNNPNDFMPSFVITIDCNNGDITTNFSLLTWANDEYEVFRTETQTQSLGCPNVGPIQFSFSYDTSPRNSGTLLFTGYSK